MDERRREWLWRVIAVVAGVPGHGGCAQAVCRTCVELLPGLPPADLGDMAVPADLITLALLMQAERAEVTGIMAARLHISLDDASWLGQG